MGMISLERAICRVVCISLGLDCVSELVPAVQNGMAAFQACRNLNGVERWVGGARSYCG